MKISSACARIAVALLVLGGCAHQPRTKGRNPSELARWACGNTGDHQVKGSVWLKAKSKDASGQFPATVQADAPGQLVLEVTNLVGSTEAIIRIDGDHYSIQRNGRSEKDKETGRGSWSGIPLVWATDLFLGKMPCPSPDSLKDAAVSVDSKGALHIKTESNLNQEPQEFVYEFRSWSGRPWPEALRWQRKGTMPVAVDFRFDDPDDASGIPKKWEAKSDRGEVRVRWKDREASR